MSSFRIMASGKSLLKKRRERGEWERERERGRRRNRCESTIDKDGRRGVDNEEGDSGCIERKILR